MKLSETYRKIVLFLLVMLLNSAGYIGAQIIRPQGLNLGTSLDTLIPFVPQFVVAYALYLPVILLPFLLYWKNYKAYKTMALCLAAVLAVSIVIYLLFQTSVTRASISPADGVFGQFVASVYAADKPVNAFPSLHVAIPTIVTLFVYIKRKKFGITLAPITIAIILSTVLIKQHNLADVAGGLVLAFAVFYFRNKISRLLPSSF